MGKQLLLRVHISYQVVFVSLGVDVNLKGKHLLSNFKKLGTNQTANARP